MPCPGSGQFLSEQDVKQSVRWPIVMYLGLVFAAPFIIWKLLSPLVSAVQVWIITYILLSF